MAPVTHATLGEVWHLALPSGTTLLTGEAGLTHPVEWVSSLRAAYPVFGDLGQGYLALASLDLAKRLGSRFTLGNLIQELMRVQVAGLVVDQPVDDEDVALAESLGLALFLVPEGTDLRATERDVLRALVDREGQVARREMEVRENLQRTYSGGGIEAVLTHVSRMCGGPVALLDGAGVAIQHAGNPDASDIEPTPYRVTVAGRALGSLAVYAPTTGQTSPLAEIYARHAAEICGIEMLQQLTRRETEERLGAELIEQLLDQDQDQEVVTARLTRLGYKLGNQMAHMVVALALEGNDGGDLTGGEDAARDLRWIAERDGATVLSVRYREAVLAFCAYDRSLPDRRARGWAKEATESLPEGYHMGVSRTLQGIDGLRAGVLQALDAASLGQRITDRSSPYYYEELGLYRLLAGLSHRGELRRFYEETLGLLSTYDNDHNTELVMTLEAFFECNANASQTARALYVHRNTLNYRLQRIVEITGMDLNDAEARLAFQLALKIRHLAL